MESGVVRIGGADSQPKLPTKGFVRRSKVLMKNDEQGDMKSPPAGQGTEAVIIKATKQQGSKGGKQPTVIPLTKEQIDAVLRSLKVPVPVGGGQLTDATTQSSPVEEQVIEESEISVEISPAAEMQVLNEKTPVVTINTPEKGMKRPAITADSIAPEKRIKLDFPSPCSEDDSSPYSINQENHVLRFRKKGTDNVKPSPQRALHLAPEFANHEKNMAPSGDASNTVRNQSDTVEEEKKPVGKKIEIIINESTVQSHSLLSLTNSKSNQNSVTNSPVKCSTSSSNHTVVQLSNQPATFLQLPIVNIQGQGQQKVGQPVTVPVAMSQNLQIVQGGQQVVQLPVAFNTSATPSTSSTSPRVYTYSLPSNQANITVTNLQLIPQTSVKGANSTNTTLVRPVATKATASPNAGSQIVAPQVVTQSPITYLSKTPGGFIPISSSAKIIVSTNHASKQTTSGSVAVDSS